MILRSKIIIISKVFAVLTLIADHFRIRICTKLSINDIIDLSDQSDSRQKNKEDFTTLAKTS